MSCTCGAAAARSECPVCRGSESGATVRCEHTGLTKPECSCLSCLRQQLAVYAPHTRRLDRTRSFRPEAVQGRAGRAI